MDNRTCILDFGDVCSYILDFGDARSYILYFGDVRTYILDSWDVRRLLDFATFAWTLMGLSTKLVGRPKKKLGPGVKSWPRVGSDDFDVQTSF
jgi:hypothetical protein